MFKRIFLAPDTGSNTSGATEPSKSETTTEEAKTYSLSEIEELIKDRDRYKNAVTKANAENADYKRQLKDKMSEEERTQSEREEKDKAYETLRVRFNTTLAEKELLSAGMKEDEYKDLLPLLVTEDEEKTVKLAKEISKIISTRTSKSASELAEARQTATQEANAKFLKDSTKKPIGTSTTQSYGSMIASLGRTTQPETSQSILDKYKK